MCAATDLEFNGIHSFGHDSFCICLVSLYALGMCVVIRKCVVHLSLEAVSASFSSRFHLSIFHLCWRCNVTAKRFCTPRIYLKPHVSYIS